MRGMTNRRTSSPPVSGPASYAIYVNSRLAFLGLSSAGMLVSVAVLALMITHAHRGSVVLFVGYLLLVSLYLVALWRSTRTIRLAGDTLQTGMLFGLFRSRRLPLADVVQISLSGRSENMLTRMVLHFRDGTRVCLHSRQSNYVDAYFFIKKRCADVPRTIHLTAQGGGTGTSSARAASR